MGVVRSVFLNDQQARVALERLRAVFPDEQINMRSFRSMKAESDNASDYDPIGGVRLAGTAITTLPATGATLVGNSTTLDLSLGELDDILAMVAEGEHRGQYRRSATRIVASVEVNSDDEAEQARSIMDACGGRDLSTDRRGISDAPTDQQTQTADVDVSDEISEPTSPTSLSESEIHPNTDRNTPKE